MDRKPAVLLVDDDPLLHELVQDILGDLYDVNIASTGGEGIASAQSLTPDVVLMDIMMADMNGYDACAAIKALPVLADVPVIFLSGLTEPDDRLRAYEVGGSDFLAKPFAPAELLNKVNGVIARQLAHKEMADSAQNAFQVAMTAMTSASEIGTVLQYVTRAVQAGSAQVLAEATIEAVSAYGLSASVQLRGATGVLSVNAAGASSPLEIAVLSNLSSCGRIVNFGSRYAFNYASVTLLVTDMPIDDEARCGRLRDHLLVIAEVAHSRMDSLDNQLRLKGTQDKMLELFDRVQALLTRMASRSRWQQEQSATVLKSMLDRMEDAFLFLGLTESQESAVANMLHKAVEESQSSFGPDIEESRAVSELLADMAKLIDRHRS